MNQINLGRIDLNLLVVFEVVFHERHVGRAAERLSLTQSAVSHRLARLRRLLHDPLFLKTPKGVVPTARAAELQTPIADVLAQVRNVVSSAGPFDPVSSTRRFTIGAPDGVSAVFLSSLLADLHRSAPGIDIGVRQLLPLAGESAPERAWRPAFAELEEGLIDLAVIPTDDVPTRFASQTLYEESFVLATRRGHPLHTKPSLDRYCGARHLVVSLSGDPRGFVDEALAEAGRSRRVVATVPNFMFALAVVAETDLVCALPRRFATVHAGRFGVVAVDPPFRLKDFRLNVVVARAALRDAGVAWLFARVLATRPSGRARSERKARSL